MNDSKPKRYVVGFVFNHDLSQVVLLTKARPADQKGKLNGVGGHIEPYDASPHEAMRRECLQETGLVIRCWAPMGFVDSRATEFNYTLEIFWSWVGDARLTARLFGNEDEPVAWYKVSEVLNMKKGELADGVQEWIVRARMMATASLSRTMTTKFALSGEWASAMLEDFLATTERLENALRHQGVQPEGNYDTLYKGLGILIEKHDAIHYQLAEELALLRHSQEGRDAATEAA